MGVIAQLAAGLAAVLLSSWLFTNGLEWFGLRAAVPHGVLGSVFAALGTAMPEASIALLAAIATGSAARGVGDAVSIGAVLGAPLLLATLGFAVLGLGGFRAGGGTELKVSARGLRRDLVFFLGAFGASGAVGVLHAPAVIRWPVGALLMAAYAVFVGRTLAQDVAPAGAAASPPALILGRLTGQGSVAPSWAAIALQLGVALGMMLGGAEFFVHTLTDVSLRFGLSGFTLAALIVPLATELPETLNSLVWLRQGKDALATGNVTGAMVLQGAVIPGLAMWFTPWAFGRVEAVAAAVALLGALTVLAGFRAYGRLSPRMLLPVGLLYVAFLGWVL